MYTFEIHDTPMDVFINCSYAIYFVDRLLHICSTQRLPMTTFWHNIRISYAFRSGLYILAFPFWNIEILTLNDSFHVFILFLLT